MARSKSSTFLMSGVLEAWDWFDNGLQNLVMDAGFRPLNKSQSMMVLYISAGIQRPIEIARKMRLSRQAIGHIATQLMDLGIVVAKDDPTDGRSMILSFTEKSSSLRSFAQMAILDLEETLCARLGKRDFQILRNMLELEWGPTVKTSTDLSQPSRASEYMKTHGKTAGRRKQARTI